MTAYDTFDPTSLFAAGDDFIAREITLLAGSAPLVRGTVLGRVTASDKYIVSVETASDGSQTPAAILAADADPTASDVIAPAYFQGEFVGEQLTMDASWSIATLEAAFRNANEQIYIRSVGVLG